MKIKLTIEYEGTNYVGWQRQINGVAVQQKLEECLFHIFKEPVTVVGASRTDSGVHAYGQVAHFIPPKELKEIDYLLALNTKLPRDIRVLKAEEVSDDFHAIYSAQSKIYEYCIFNKPQCSALNRAFSTWIPEELDVSLMSEATQYLIGRHDFKSFQAKNSHIVTTVREVYEARWKESEKFLIFEIKGSGFLKYMVRIIMGTLLEVGKKQIPPGELNYIVQSKQRSLAGPTAPPQGLYLREVLYE